MTENRADDWWRQAQNDLKFARAALSHAKKIYAAAKAALEGMRT